ncbi:MAG: acyl-CoA dehydrogenase N-terminal domain-containing protein, partial [Planctomycetes bacterium]|nr:acyl-CoA dehydrogenase N-terminal domain-containing protein [Planctomycetota bacterium]
MPRYAPPLRDMQFVLHEVLDAVGELRACPPHAELDADTFDAVLEEAGKFAAKVAFPLNVGGDTEGCTLDRATHEVRAPRGFKEAYAQYVEGGWNALAFPEEIGGQGLPQALAIALVDALNGACMSF